MHKPIVCKQFTYTESELKQESIVELQRTIRSIEDVLPQLVGNMWPHVLRSSHEAISEELRSRATAEGLCVNHYILPPLNEEPS